jgi:hypothetical protein
MKARRAAAVTPPLAATQPKTWELLRLDDVYTVSAARDALFVEALVEHTRWHLDRNPTYRAICAHGAFVPERDLATIADLRRLPAIGADVPKVCDLVTLRDVDYFTVSSSGTGGARTTIPLDLETVLRMWRMGEACFDADALRADEPVDYVILAPDPQASPGHGNAQFFQALTEAAPARTITYGLVADGRGGLQLASEQAGAALVRAAAAGRPVRVLGLPALVTALAETFAHGPVTCADGSLVLTGAGWKRDTAVAIPKADLRRLIGRAWGIPDARVRDLYGMTEHAVHYLECRAHRFHPPAFARVRIVDPLSGAAVPDGEEGVVHLINPGFSTMPLHSLVTADVGRACGPCPCGRATPAFEVARRGGTSRFRGCAATTLERIAS